MDVFENFPAMRAGCGLQWIGEVLFYWMSNGLRGTVVDGSETRLMKEVYISFATVVPNCEILSLFRR